MAELTNLLSAIDRGESGAAEKLWPLVYGELRRLAGAQLSREKWGHTLDATALVHEAYVRLAADADPGFANRRHFFFAASQAMRRILVESARAKGRTKRGGDRKREFPVLDDLSMATPDEDLLALHDALDQFAVQDPVKARLVELRFFTGMTLEQAAECLDISLSSANRAWRYARAWLYDAMSGNKSEKK
jgi:RNA polymerase sigma factor (TIGR02999 family)